MPLSPPDQAAFLASFLAARAAAGVPWAAEVWRDDRAQADRIVSRKNSAGVEVPVTLKATPDFPSARDAYKAMLIKGNEIPPADQQIDAMLNGIAFTNPDKFFVAISSRDVKRRDGSGTYQRQVFRIGLRGGRAAAAPSDAAMALADKIAEAMVA